MGEPVNVSQRVAFLSCGHYKRVAEVERERNPIVCPNCMTWVTLERFVDLSDSSDQGEGVEA